MKLILTIIIIEIGSNRTLEDLVGLIGQFKEGDTIEFNGCKVIVKSNRACLNIEAPKHIKITITKAKKEVSKPIETKEVAS